MKRFEQQLAALDDLRRSIASEEAVRELRKALGNRNNYYVSRAARVTAELKIRALIPDLLAAFERFFDNPVRTDPQCWAISISMNQSHTFADYGISSQNRCGVARRTAPGR